MICFRDRTLCTAACRCSRCDLRLDDAVRRAEEARWLRKRDGGAIPVRPQ